MFSWTALPCHTLQAFGSNCRSSLCIVSPQTLWLFGDVDNAVVHIVYMHSKHTKQVHPIPPCSPKNERDISPVFSRLLPVGQKTNGATCNQIRFWHSSFLNDFHNHPLLLYRLSVELSAYVSLKVNCDFNIKPIFGEP